MPKLCNYCGIKNYNMTDSGFVCIYCFNFNE